MNRLNEELFLGNYNSVLSDFKKEINEEKDELKKNELKKDYESLVKKKLIKTKVDAKLLDDIVNDVISTGLELEKKLAEFPCVENNTCIGFLSIFSSNLDNNKKIFQDKSEINFLKVLTSFKSFIQKNLKDIKTKKIHTLVLNWGEYFNIYELFQENDSKYYHKNEKNITDNSYHFAALVSFFSSVLNYEINSNYIFSGAFDEEGKSQAISYLTEKLDKIFIERPNIEKIFIPINNKEEVINHSLYSKIVLIDSFKSLIKEVFSDDISKLTCKEESFYNNIGISRLSSECIGDIDIEFVKNDHTKRIVLQNKRERKKIIILRFAGEPNYNEFPFDINILENHIFKEYDVVIFEGKIPAYYLANFISTNAQTNQIFSMRVGNDNSKEIIVFANPKGGSKNLIGNYIVGNNELINKVFEKK